MGPRENLERNIQLLAEGLITPLECENKLCEHVWQLPASERGAVVAGLQTHADKRVREIARRLETLLRHEALSKDFDHVQRTSPLQPGTRLTLFGGYSNFAEGGRPAWLGGRDYYAATFLRFERRERDRIPVALIAFEEPVSVPDHVGRFGVLIGTYGSDGPAWARAEGTVLVHVAEAMPDDVVAFLETRPYDSVLETHASYRLEGVSVSTQ